MKADILIKNSAEFRFTGKLLRKQRNVFFKLLFNFSHESGGAEV